MTGNNATYTYGTSGTSKGRPIRIVDGSGMYECGYDNLGNVRKETRTIAMPNSFEVYRFTTRYAYDSWGRMDTVTYPDGEAVSYRYTWGGDLFAMDGRKNGITQPYIRGIFYNKFGQRDSVYYGNGTRALYSYDALHRLSHLTSFQQDGTVMQDIDYTFDNASNITHIHDQASAIGILGGGYNNWYEYDALHRLIGSNGYNTLGHYDYTMDYTASGRIMGKLRGTPSGSRTIPADIYYGYCNDEKPHAVRRIFDDNNGKHYDLRWDAAGNLGQISTGNPDALFESGRFLFWTEDSRLYAVVDNKYTSYYAYDHSGERRIKLTGTNTVLDVNADFMRSISSLDKVTLYPSAYMVLDNHGYTKHYYAGTERVAARIGGGGINAFDLNPTLYEKAAAAFRQGLEHLNNRYLTENDADCILNGLYSNNELLRQIEEIPAHLQSELDVDYEKFRKMMQSMQHVHHEEPDVYFYHSDHLGSASWITDNGGIAIQHLQYLPYGEPFVDKRMSGYNERFTFTGKERDEETGYGYFGARYMDHELLTSFISVDRYASKYPSISPYAYCGWNPIRLTDPTGDTICINGQHYKPGMSSNGLDEFSKKAVDALNTMYGTDEGRSLIDKLLSSDNMFTIEEAATSEFKPLDRRRACLAQLKTDPDYQTEYQGWLDIGFDFNGGSGGTILWNPTGSILPTEKGGQVCATTDLAHEMFHALDADQGMMDYRVEKGISRNDWQAVYHENILRGQMGLPLRTHYRKQMTSNGVFVGGSGEMMISEGKPIRPSWY